eukprot:Gb_40318 [translate_table: standard]
MLEAAHEVHCQLPAMQLQ